MHEACQFTMAAVPGRQIFPTSPFTLGTAVRIRSNPSQQHEDDDYDQDGADDADTAMSVAVTVAAEAAAKAAK